jgi:hypothetical protein
VAPFRYREFQRRFSKSAVTSSGELKPGFALDGYLAEIASGFKIGLAQFIGGG